MKRRRENKILHKNKIIIVDDDEAILSSIKDYLTLAGYDVDTAKTGKEAIVKSKNHFFNLAVLDIKLPDMEGTELLTKMHETRPKMMKIMLTGYPDLENAAKALNKGADAYLIKPIKLQELQKVIEDKLSQQQNELKMNQEKIVEYLETRAQEVDEKKQTESTKKSTKK